MLQSMTGFGKSEIVINHIRYSIDIKSLNSRNVDLNVRLPQWLRSNELKIRKQVSEQLQRGKIDVYINTLASENTQVNLNTDLIKKYMDSFLAVSPTLSENERFRSAMQMPDILNNEQEEMDEQAWNNFVTGLDNAIAKLKEFRKDEGKILEQEFDLRIHNILELLLKVPAFETERIERLKERIKKSLNEVQEADADRFEQELIFYLEKLDITEEKVRLKNHCEYFLETMNSDESNGKKLNFICQEIGREINTLGSKSNHAEMQKIVVEMKDELEKIKEQMLNVL